MSLNSVSLDALSVPTRMPWIDRLARRSLLQTLAACKYGTITLEDPAGVSRFANQAEDAHALVRVERSRFFRRLMLGGNLGAAASWIDGDWTCDDLTSLLRIMQRNLSQLDQMNRGLARLGESLAKPWHWARRNTRAGSRRNIHEHYDLGNDFFACFLDPTMCYSCGVYENEQATLHDASVAKLDRLCRMLDLSPSDHLLEIGTGWGGMAIHAAQRFGCRVTTTTISREQHDYAQAKVRQLGLSDQVNILLQDYRDLDGQYDKLVSIEMIEAVGHRFLPTYFGKCASLLKPDGLMAIQGITMPDHRYERYRRSTDFIQQYVFPGSCCPSMTAMMDAVARASDLRLVGLEEIGPHYARTLRDWRQRFNIEADRIRTLGYSQRLMRMWQFYLSYCEAGFAERHTGCVQMMLAKPGYRGQLPWSLQSGAMNAIEDQERGA